MYVLCLHIFYMELASFQKDFGYFIIFNNPVEGIITSLVFNI